MRLRTELSSDLSAIRPADFSPLPSCAGFGRLEDTLAETDGNGAAPQHQREKVRVAIIGVGNCASSFVQGVQFYRDADPAKQVPGLMHVDLGGYHVRDIEFTCAFDVNETKVGKDLGEAIWADPNNTIKFSDVPSNLAA
jgi:myo-inositol-1-phosphate synthase